MAPQRLSVKNAAKILSSEGKNSELEKFLAYLLIEGNLRPLTLEGYRRDLRRFSAWCKNAGLDFEEMTQRRLLDYLEHLSSDLSARSRARHLSSLRQFFRWRGPSHEITRAIEDIAILQRVCKGRRCRLNCPMF